MLISIRRRQDICAYIFCILFLTNFVFQTLQYFSVVPYNISGYVYVIGGLAVVGFAVLLSLAHNEASQIFAFSQIGIELYFAFGLSYLKHLARTNLIEDLPVYIFCGGFCLLSLYFWSILFNSNKFSVEDMRWISFLPLNYLLNICVYWDAISDSFSTNMWIDGIDAYNPYFMPLRWALLPAMIVGYWRLSHSKWFDGTNDDIGFPNLSPFNRYFGGYVVTVCIIMIIFVSIRHRPYFVRKI